jgi:hypothetical protein
MSFVSELRRRQVLRTAAWYGGLAWLAIEVANTVFPQFGLPEWSMRAGSARDRRRALARAGGLRVIARSSVQEYRDPKRILRDAFPKQ